MATAPMPGSTRPQADQELSAHDELTARLSGKFLGISAEAVGACVTAEFARFAHARLRAFVPILVNERSAANSAT